MREFHYIVEFSYAVKKQFYILRFLDGSCLKVNVENLPTKYRVKSAHWEEAELSKTQDALVVTTNKRRLVVPAFVLYASGKLI